MILCSKKHHWSDYHVHTSSLISMWPIAFFQIAFAVAAIKICQFFHNLHWLGTCLTDSCVCICGFTTMSQFNCILKNLSNPTLYKLPCWIVWARVHQMSRRAHCWSHFFICLGLHCHNLAGHHSPLYLLYLYLLLNSKFMLY